MCSILFVCGVLNHSKQSASAIPMLAVLCKVVPISFTDIKTLLYWLAADELLLVFFLWPLRVCANGCVANIKRHRKEDA